MTKEEFARRLTNACDAVIQAEAELTEIDSQFGDADHGLTMTKVAKAIAQAVAASDGGIQTMLDDAAMAVMALNGGSAVPLWNTWLDGMQEEAPEGSEINVAVTDFMLILGHVWQIEDNTYRFENAKVFFVPKGTAVEMYQTTLHLSPCRVCDAGFKGVVILPRGTNTPLDEKTPNGDPESKLLLQRNKWVIAHPEREPLIKQGAYPGLLGENKELHY